MTLKFPKELKVGLLSVAAIITFYFGFNYLKGIELLSPTRTYFTVYEEIDGLTIANPVLLSGMPVGRVADIRIMQNDNNKVLVVLEVDKKITLGNRSTAVLVNIDFLGSQAVKLEIPNLEMPFTDGDTIKGVTGKTMTESLQEEALPVIQSFQDLSKRLTEVMEIVIKNEEHVSKTMENVGLMSAHYEEISRRNKEQVTVIVRSLRELTDMLKDENEGIKPLLANVTAITDSLKNINMGMTMQKLDSTLGQLNVTMNSINNGEGTVHKLLTDEAVYDNLAAVLEDLDKLLIDMKENPKEYVHFSLFGKKSKK